MQPSIISRVTLTAVVLALTMTVVILWLFRFSLLGLTDFARRKAF